jgi:hypothetical protein
MIRLPGYDAYLARCVDEHMEDDEEEVEDDQDYYDDPDDGICDQFWSPD